MNNIERKFLVSSDIERWLNKQTFNREKIEQFYVKSENDTECNYLKYFPDTYIKIMIDRDGNEESVPVSEENYRAKRKKHLGRKLVKNVYTIVLGDETFVVSKYRQSLKDLYMLSVYTENEKVMRESQTLESLQPFILKGIDKDKKYSSRLLSLAVKPIEYDINKLFDKIDAYESANLFFWQVPRRIYVRDGVALVLYRNLRLLHYYKVNYQRKHMSATLHRLRVLLRRTATLLETFPHLFTPGVQSFCANILVRYHEETKILRYLYFLEEYAGSRENVKLSLHSELKNLVAQEEKEITQMILSQPFVQMIQILTRELYDQEHHQYKSLKKEIKKTVRKKLKEFESLLAQTAEGYDDEMLEKLYIALDSLQTLIEDFYHIIGEKEVHRLVEEFNILLKPLREYRNCKERAGVLKEIKAQSENKMLDTDPLLCEHVVELEEKIAYALKLLRTSRFYV